MCESQGKQYMTEFETKVIEGLATLNAKFDFMAQKQAHQSDDIEHLQIRVTKLEKLIVALTTAAATGGGTVSAIVTHLIGG